MSLNISKWFYLEPPVIEKRTTFFFNNLMGSLDNWSSSGFIRILLRTLSDTHLTVGSYILQKAGFLKRFCLESSVTWSYWVLLSYLRFLLSEKMVLLGTKKHLYKVLCNTQVVTVFPKWFYLEPALRKTAKGFCMIYENILE